jgi:hypothetical protein
MGTYNSSMKSLTVKIPVDTILFTYTNKEIGLDSKLPFYEKDPGQPKDVQRRYRLKVIRPLLLHYFSIEMINGKKTLVHGNSKVEFKTYSPLDEIKTIIQMTKNDKFDGYYLQEEDYEDSSKVATIHLFDPSFSYLKIYDHEKLW